MCNFGLPDVRPAGAATRLIHLSALALLLLLLAGCSFRTELTLYEDEKWEYLTVVDLTHEEDGGLGGPALQEAFKEEEAEAGLEQIEFEYNREVLDDTVRYTAKMSGQGYDLLRSQLSDDFPIDLLVRPDGSIQVELPMKGDDSILPISQEFHLHAGRIIESNAATVKGGTATWTSADMSARDIDTITALVEPIRESGFNILRVVAIVAVVGILLAAGGGVLLYRLSRRSATVDVGSG